MRFNVFHQYSMPPREAYQLIRGIWHPPSAPPADTESGSGGLASARLSNNNDNDDGRIIPGLESSYRMQATPGGNDGNSGGFTPGGNDKSYDGVTNTAAAASNSGYPQPPATSAKVRGNPSVPLVYQLRICFLVYPFIHGTSSSIGLFAGKRTAGTLHVFVFVFHQSPGHIWRGDECQPG